MKGFLVFCSRNIDDGVTLKRDRNEEVGSQLTRVSKYKFKNVHGLYHNTSTNMCHINNVYGELNTLMNVHMVQK